MPLTRSKSGKRTLGQLTHDNMEQISSEESSAATATGTTTQQGSSTPPQETPQTSSYPTTSPSQDTPQTSSHPVAPPPQETPQSSPHLAAPPPSRSIRTTSSRRARRLAQAREEALKIKLELAQARIAILEAEDTDNEDAETTLSTVRSDRRVDEWLEASHRHVLAIADVPHNEETPEPANPQSQKQVPARHTAAGMGSDATAVRREAPALPLAGAAAHVGNCARHTAAGAGPDATAARHEAPAPSPAGAAAHGVNCAFFTATSTGPDATAARHELPADVSVFVPAPQPSLLNREYTVRPPPPNAYSTSMHEGNAVSKSQNVDLSELASAIAIAARAGHREMPRYQAELPQFSGSHQEWLSFKAAYSETASTYSEVENIARLRRCLKGRAKEAVENLLIYNARAEEIMRSLESRFGRPDAIALAELERLRALPRLNDGPRDICVFASRVANVVATLRALDRAHYLYSPETTRAMMEKLTPALRYRWFDFATTQNTEEPELLKLSAFLQREADYCALYAQPENVDTPSLHPTKRTHKTFVTTEKPAIKCAHCNSPGHHIEQCAKFKDKSIDDRWKTAKDQRLCFRCLRYRTKTHSCKRVECGQDDCKYSHHRLLHYEKKEEKSEAVTSTWAPREARAYLKIIPVTISGPAGAVDTHALLDDGSTITLVHEDIARETGLDGPTEPLLIEAITKERINASGSRRVTMNIRGTGRTHEVRARTIEDLRLSPQSVKAEDLRDCAHLHDIEEHLKYKSATPKVLIGQDNWQLLVSQETRQGQRHQPVASLTMLGWVLHGAHTRSIGKRVHAIHHMTARETEEKRQDMDAQLSEYFALESLLVAPKLPRSSPEECARAILTQSVKTTEDGHYEAPLLWKQADARLPDNYENTLRRLHNVEKKLDRDPALKKRYNEEMDALITKGYAEPAPPAKSKRVWYLPHFAVMNPAKPGKIRIVHDAAAATRRVSLNDRLLTGPDLLQSLPGVLMRFRQHSIAVGADIKEMFMQVKVKPEDRDALRYLWRGDQRGDITPQEYRMTSLIFGATCSPSIAIYVKNVNAQRYEETHPEAVKAIVKHHYVDDYLQSFETEEQAIRVACKVRDIHREARYELRQWTSNSSDVFRALTAESAAPAHVDLNKTEMKNERVLGQIWKPATDEIAFNLDLTRLPPGALDNAEPTKRQVLKIMMSVFDPLGLASPVTIIAKKILQEVWRRGTDWDAKLDHDLAQKWVEWTRHLRALRDVAVPRVYPHYSDATTRELHVFVDASETAYTSALYWRVITSDGQVHMSLIAAKAKVAPLKVTSIPRLELQAAVMGSRMAAAVIEEHDLKPDTKTFWTDSRTVLAWLRTGARTYRPFVAHRIATIEEITAIKEWRWVPTKLNVADEATRDAPLDFNSDHRWFKGPEFLRGDPSTWPAEPSQPHEGHKIEEKVHTLCTEKGPRLHTWLPAPDRFSKWERLLRTVGRVLQFIDLCRPLRARTNYKRAARNKQVDPEWNKRRKPAAPRPPSKKPQDVKKYKILDASYLREAERLIVRASQHESFGDDINNLRNNKPPSSHSRLRLLAVELVNDTITVKTRINAAVDIAELQKRPPVLDGDHPATRLYIDYVHRQMHHNGVEATINECKQHYSILRLRPVTKMVIRRCLLCRIKKTAPSVPPTGDHPRSRLAHHQRPFTYTGLDIFGPVSVTVGRGTQKRYVALFTCLTVRAVHLEVIPSLSGDSAVMALRRMIARRGCPSEIWSDNGTNFHAANRELREAYEDAIRAGAAEHAISWKFIPAGAPFMGGAWERMVRAVKGALHAVLNERHPSEETLATLLAEAEYTVNSRPLTHVPVELDEPEAITPNHFLLNGSARVPVPGTFDDTTLIGRATWRTSQRLADHFWARWLREYLPSLQYRREPYGRGRPISVDDIVLVVDGNLPRNTWPRGRVIAVYPGPDGVTRAVDVATKGGVLRRPTKKLVILPTEPVDLHAKEDATLTRAMHGGRDVQDGNK